MSASCRSAGRTASDGFTVLAGGGLGMSPGVKATHPRLADPFCTVAPGELFDVVRAIVAVHRDFGNRDEPEARAPEVRDRRAGERPVQGRGRGPRWAGSCAIPRLSNGARGTIISAGTSRATGSGSSESAYTTVGFRTGKASSSVPRFVRSSRTG